MPQSIKDRLQDQRDIACASMQKQATFHEYRKLNSAAYAIAHRAKGTPFEARAKAIHAITLSELSNFQHDPEATIDTLQDHDLTPLMLLLGHIVATEF